MLPEGSEPRVLRAAAEVSRRGLADITLLGNAHAVQARSLSVQSQVHELQWPAACRFHDLTPILSVQWGIHGGTQQP